jgi:hypothetical protein
MLELEGLSSDQLLAQLLDLVHRGRKLEADLIAHLAEVDERKLYLREGCSSMFAYCVGVLRFAEAVAYKRIAAMRATRRYPELLMALRNGDLHLTAVSLLAPQLTAENVTALLTAARHRTADEIRRMLADRQPKPDVASAMRRLSAPSVVGASTARFDSSVRCDLCTCAEERGEQGSAKTEIRRSVLDNESGLTASVPAEPTKPLHTTAHSARPLEPLGNQRYAIRFTADREFHAQIQELKSLMRHQVPDGDVGEILAKAVAVLLKQVRARKFGECSTPRSARRKRVVQTEQAERVQPAQRVESTERTEPAEGVVPVERTTQVVTCSPSRWIPAAIRRAVSKRDGERCTFVSGTGRRCDSRDFLEFHHRRPWARHRSHAIDGITLRCRAHNQYEAERDFGAKHMAQIRKRGQPQIAALLPETSVPVPDQNPRRPSIRTGFKSS